MQLFFDQKLLDAYLRTLYGVGALLFPEIQEIILSFSNAKFGLKHSFSENNNDSLVIDGKIVIDKIKSEGLIGPPQLRTVMTQVHSVFLIATWEILKENPLFEKIQNESEIQFFRHLRNASAHDNHFYFKDYKKLPYSAKWRTKEITIALAGKPVFPSFLKDGDVFLLLGDINQKYFSG